MQYGAPLPMPVEELALPRLPEGRIAPREVEESRKASYQHAQPSLRAGVAAVWRDTLSTFSAQSLPILTFALAGFLGVTLIGALVSMMLHLDFDARTNLKDSASTVHRMMTLLAAHERQLLVVTLIQAVAGMLAVSFARGVIIWLALHVPQQGDASERRGNIGQAMRMTLQHVPTLLVTSLLYGAFITAGIVATSGLTNAMEFAPSKIVPVWDGPQRAFSDGLRQLVWRGLNTLLPNPGPPFAEFMPDLRHGIVKPTVQLTPYEQWLAVQYGVEAIGRTKSYTLGLQSNYAPGIWMMAHAGVLLIFLTEPLLRFGTVMTMHLVNPVWSRRPHRVGLFAPLFASVRFGVRHFGEITAHIWLVRLAIFALCLCLIEFPSAVMDNFAAPVIVSAGALRVGGSEVLPIMKFIAGAGAALVGAILLAFSIVYDARLYLALSAKTNPQTNLWQMTETSQAHSLMGKSVRGGSERRLRYAVSISPFCSFKQEET